MARCNLQVDKVNLRQLTKGVVAILLLLAASAQNTGQSLHALEASPNGVQPPQLTPTLKSPPLPVLSPTALCGDAGDGRVYLRWNPQLEDERVLGWKVRQTKPTEAELTDSFLTEPAFIVHGLENGTSYTFVLVGVLKDGSFTPPSNTAVVTPHATGTANVIRLKPRKANRTRISFLLANSATSTLVKTRFEWCSRTARNSLTTI